MNDAEARNAFEELYHATYRQVLAYCRRRTVSLEDADDATAATFMVAWRRLEDVIDAEYPLAWLYAVAFRTLGNQRRSRRRSALLRIRLQGLPHDPPSDGPESYATGSSEVASAFAALARLSRRDQELIRLAAFEGLSYAEMAAVVGISESAVRSRLYRARKRLRAAIEKGPSSLGRRREAES